MKRVSFKVAKALKEAGYPQDKSNNNQYYTKGGQLSDLYYYGVPYYDVDCFAPTYLEVWLWLWRKKKWFIKIQPVMDKFHYQILDHHYDEWHSWGVLSMTDFLDPEEAIIAAIEFLVDNNLLK